MDDYIDCGIIPERISSGSITVSGVIKATHDGALHSIFAKGAGGGSNGWGVIQDSRSVSTGTLKFEIYGATGGRQLSTRIYFQNNEFFHFCFTFNINTLECKAYKNAVLIGTTTFADPGIYEHTTYRNIIIGKYVTSQWYFKGTADAFKLWKTALTADEVLQDYESFNGNIQFCDNGDIKAPRFVEDDTMDSPMIFCDNGVKTLTEFNELNTF